MLPDARGGKLADISARMSLKSNYASKYKARLLNHGIINERTNGRVDFYLPAFREYLKELPADE